MSTTTESSSEEKKDYKTFRFVDYRVYQESKKWFQEVASLKGLFEAHSDLWYQLRANMNSLVMNIAAASTKLPNDAKRYLGNSITAINKAVACLDIACDLQTITHEEFENFTEGFKGIIIQLKSFIKALGSRKTPDEAVNIAVNDKENVTQGEAVTA